MKRFDVYSIGFMMARDLTTLLQCVVKIFPLPLFYLFTAVVVRGSAELLKYGLILKGKNK